MCEKESDKGQAVRIPELLAPAGNYEKLVTAIHYGADAVYLGGREFSLRAKAGNFSMEKIAEAVAYSHKHGVKVYVTVNVIAHNDDLDRLQPYLREVAASGADAIIVSDPGILAAAQKCVPQLPIHLSTQANVTNYGAAAFWAGQGVTRLNLARELSLAEITAIRGRVRAELEVFVHGALCISYSGRCMLSSYMTGRDANKGNCAHPCRYSYSLMEEKRPGQYFPVEEDERGTYIFNAKDLCLLESLPLLLGAGVDSLKIEGRMKSIFYVGGVVRLYRAALDYLAALPQDAWHDCTRIQLPRSFMEEVVRTGTRGNSENFLQGKPGPAEMVYATSRVEQSHEPVAVIREAGEEPLVEIRNTIEPGGEVEVMGRGLADTRVRVVALLADNGEALPKANPGNRLRLVTEPRIGKEVAINTILRRKIPGSCS